MRRALSNRRAERTSLEEDDVGYYQALELKAEPFSISPDPAYFYRSPAHQSALERLEISLRLKRGLCLVLGDVGTGKTTLGRVLVQSFARESEFDLHLILNPLYQSEFQFLEALCRMFRLAGPFHSTMDCLEALQNELYRRNLSVHQTPVLLIDEGQNLSLPIIEVLRALLNYETNEHKLLQLVILSQLEALPRFRRIRNFMDRVSFKHVLNPFDETDARDMIRFRLERSGWKHPQLPFTEEALGLIFEETQGYPRRINLLCQKLMEMLVMEDRKTVNAEDARRLVERERATP